jgi:hypothetical protein
MMSRASASGTSWKWVSSTFCDSGHVEALFFAVEGVVAAVEALVPR